MMLNMLGRFVGFLERIPLAARRRMLTYYGIALIIGTHIPRLKLGQARTIPIDKALHVVAFMGLAGLLMLACIPRKAERPFVPRSILISAAIAFIWGGITEITQELFVYQRYASIKDVLCNLAGVGLAITIGFMLRKASPLA